MHPRRRDSGSKHKSGSDHQGLCASGDGPDGGGGDDDGSRSDDEKSERSVVELQGGVVDSRVNPLSCMESQEEQVRAEATEVTMVEATMVDVRRTTGRCGRPWHVVKG